MMMLMSAKGFTCKVFTVGLIVGGKEVTRKKLSTGNHQYGVIMRIQGRWNQKLVENVLLDLFKEYGVRSS